MNTAGPIYEELVALAGNEHFKSWRARKLTAAKEAAHEQVLRGPAADREKNLAVFLALEEIDAVERDLAEVRKQLA